MFIQVKNIRKGYGEGTTYTEILKGIDTAIEKGTICTILGPSGSGKTTLLNLIGGVDEAGSGGICIDGLAITDYDEKRLAKFRRDYLGYVFQFYNLIPNLTVKENIQVSEYLTAEGLDIEELLDTVGLTEHQYKFPGQLSGGQQQRCAIARALVKNPKVLLCDEPTGALDYQTSKEILALLDLVNDKYGTTMVIVTHNEAIPDMAHKTIRLKDGCIESESVNSKRKTAFELQW